MGDENIYVPDLPDKEWPPTPCPSSRLGAALDGWRSLSWRCGDEFAHWAVDVIGRRMNRFALLRACVVVAQAAGAGEASRRAVAELLAPDVWVEVRSWTLG